MELPELVIFVVIDPKTKEDQEKLGQGLRVLFAEDSTFRVNTDTLTGHTIIRGAAERQLEVIVDRLKREFHVAATIGKPQVAYRETIRGTAEADKKFAKQTGGHGQYAHVKIRIEPLPAGTGFQFVNDIMGGKIPEEYIKPTEAGIVEALEGGIVAGYPMSDVKVSLYDGSFHEVDSSAIAFKIAGLMALKEAAQRAKPVLLEPIMSVEVAAPDEYIGNVVGDLESRRGRIEGMELRGATQIIKSSAPLSKMLGYAIDLRSRTQGHASYTMQFDRYEPLSGGPDTDDEDCGAPVAAPRTPTPKGKQSRVALPEPDDG
jgi:elongation factor G